MLDAAGHEIASVFRPVRGLIPGKGRAYFDVTVPDATSYRVNVDSIDLVEFGPGSPILTGSLDDLRPVAVENRTRNDKERVGSFRRHRLEGAIVLGTLHLDNGGKPPPTEPWRRLVASERIFMARESFP